MKDKTVGYVVLGAVLVIALIGLYMTGGPGKAYAYPRCFQANGMIYCDCNTDGLTALRASEPVSDQELKSICRDVCGEYGLASRC